MLKSTTENRYKEWCKTAKKSDKFHWQGKGYTQKEFDELHFGGSSSKDVEVKHDNNLEQELNSKDHSES